MYDILTLNRIPKLRRIASAVIVAVVMASVMLPFALPQPAYAATQTLSVDGEGTSTDGAYSGGAANYTNMNSDDGDTTTLYENPDIGVNRYHDWSFSSFTSGYQSITSVTLYIKAKDSQYGYTRYDITPYCVISGTKYYGSLYYANAPDYRTDSYTWSNNPATGTAWTDTAINGATFGVRYMKSNYNDTVYFTYIYLNVAYNPISAPTVTTGAVTNITATTATGNGNVTSDGGSAITERGTVISTSANPTIADTKDIATGTTGAFTTSIDGLTKGTTYHVRAFATNAIGTSYGSDVTFTTLDDPTISTVAASQIAATTARLNSNVTFDGNESCSVTFVYTAGTGFADYAAINADASKVEVAASGTYTTGQLPYVDITGLTASTAYSFAVKVVNSVSTGYGSVLTFTTSSGIFAPSSLTAIPYGTSVSLIWPKGTGSTYSLLRYSIAGYPDAVTLGTLGYLGTGTSVEVTGLTQGTTYYWSIWGMSGGTYSDNYTTALCTTLAYDTAAKSDIDIETPAENSMWMQSPSTSKLQDIPMLNAVVAMWNDSYKAPDTTIWYFIWFMVGIGGGIVLYNRTSYNLVATFGAELIWFGAGAVVGLLWLWIVFVLLIIAFGFIVFGHRH